MKAAAFVVVFLLGAQDDPLKGELPRLKATEPKDAAATFRLKPGYRIELVAAEPLVASPVDMAFDEEGRLWIAEMIDYPFGDREGNPPQGRIVVLEDKDGDGRYDTRRVVADHLRWPTGLACWDGGVFVISVPDLLYVKDGRRDVVATGFGAQNVQGLANNPKWGLDHWFTASAGTNGGRLRRKDGSEFTVNGRDFRFRPTGEIEPVSGGGQFGSSFDDFGRRFVCSNSVQARHVVLDDAFLVRNPYYAVKAVTASIAQDGDAGPVFRSSPDEPWRVVRTRLRVTGQVRGLVEGGGRPSGYFTSATGITYWRGNLYVGEVAGNLVHRKSLAPSGSTFRADRMDKESEFLASSDIWFRPVNFAQGPDGGLYVCDMYRECIEHPESLPESIKKHLELTSGKDRGRIWRIVPEDAPKLTASRIRTMEESVAALARAEAWSRETGARLLFQGQDKAAVPLIEKLLAHERPETRVAALCALDGLGVRRGEALLADPVPAVREHAVRLSAPEALFDFIEGDPRVRLALVVRLADSKDPRAAAAIAKFKEGADAWLKAAIAVASGEKSAETVRKPSTAPATPVPGTSGDRKKAVEAYRDVLEKKGDAKAGHAVYQKACVGCHRAGPEGSDVGPAFVTVKQRSAEEILVAILDPNREVNPQYVSTRILTTDGSVVDGIVAAETATTVTLKREKGETETILKVKIEKMVRSAFSLMPEGLEKAIDLQQMADLIAFIRESP